MLKDFVAKKILTHFPFEASEEQLKLVDELSVFITSHDTHSLFLLKGYAGTGKTSVISALIRLYDEMKQQVILLAPTGRAAKVLAVHANKNAQTIHKKIYRQKSISERFFQLNQNLHKHTLFIVDEASMINNVGGEDSIFGNGCLLDDLVQYVYEGEGCRLLLMGDDAQLPPVNENYSPALEKTKLESYGLNVSTFLLTEVLRQSKESGVLKNATLLRKAISDNTLSTNPRFKLDSFTDIERIDGEILLEKIESAYRSPGIENTIVITRSNKRAETYNQGIRNRILQREEEIASGDLLMVVKNNYFYGKEYSDLQFIANGDIIRIKRIHRYYELYNFRFADLVIQLLDYDIELDVRILIDSLHADNPSAMKAMNERLFNSVSEDYADISNKIERMKKIAENEFHNALQLKFAYAITCHKAQGGEWNTVFIDQGTIANEKTLGIDYYRWLYTALTRTSKKLYLVNFPNVFFD